MMNDLTVSLLTEREESSLCLETAQPEFTWKLEAPERSVRQTACRLCVKDDSGRCLWDSGKLETDRQSLVYDGAELLPETTCTVSLTLWDNTGRQAQTENIFRTGLFAKDFSDSRWCGARWIGTGTRNLWAPAQTVFQLSCEITIAADSHTADLLFGANDPRLMDPDKNIWGIENLRFQSYVCLRLDIAPLESGGDAALSVFRVGYTAQDSREAPLFVLSIPRTVLNIQNRFLPHTVRVESIFGEADIFLDETKLNQPPADAPVWADGRLNLNPAGQGGDFTAFPALCDIGCRLLPGQKARYRALTVRNVRQPCSVLAEFWKDGLDYDGGPDGAFRLFDPSHGGIPMVRSEFDAGDVYRAYLTITARGVYEAYLNGEKVGSDYLMPGLTHYHKTHMYQVYDVTDMVREGGNALAVELGEGWWSGSITFRGANWNFWGDMQSVFLKLRIEHPDGSISNIVSSPETFTASDEGPIRYGSLFQGQVYDAFYEAGIAGWKEPGFRGGWKPAAEIPLSPDNAVIGSVPAMKDGLLDIRYDETRVLGQIGNGVRCTEVLKAQSMQEVRPGVYVYDFGQNIAGIPEIVLPGGFPGQEITLRYGEICYPNLPEYGENQGMLMVENLRAAHATDVVYLGDDPIVFCPKFTFHGFRYLEVTGADAPPPLEDVRARALSSVESLTADFRCSDARVERLFRNICWSLRDNFLSIPTDCPQRNERMGWSGDLSVFAHTAVYLADADAFLRRHMLAIRDLQEDNGMFPDIAPVCNGFGGILWGSAGITVPWEAYLQYGDTKILESHYDAMVRYIRYLTERVDPDTGLETAGELGDWLGPQVMKTENAMLWTAYYIYDLHIMAEAAELLGKPEAESYRTAFLENRRRFNQIYFDPVTHRTVYSGEDAARGNRMPFQPVDYGKPLPEKEPGGGYRMDTQASYCVPLALGIVEEEHLSGAEAGLAAFCQRENPDDDGILRPAYSLMTGFIGTALLLPALSQAGRDDIAYTVLQNDAYPSWLYPVRQGATTIWERLDSYTVEIGFGGHISMNSFNHYAFGAVGQWMMSRCLGIDRETPGFHTFRLSPTPDPTGAMTWAEGWCDTPAGRIESRWEQTDCGCSYTVTVPAGSSCTLELPGAQQARVTESGKAPEDSAGITVLPYGERHRFRLESGTYRFMVEQ